MHSYNTVLLLLMRRVGSGRKNLTREACATLPTIYALTVNKNVVKYN